MPETPLLAAEAVPAAGVPRRRGFGRLRSVAAVGPIGTVAAAVCLLLVAAAVLAPWIAPHDPNAVDASNVFAPPSAAHPLGTDDTGRDLLSRLIHGSRLSLLGPLLVTVIAATLGTILGVLSAWRRGWLDAVLSRVFDVLFAFPGVVLAILAAAIFGAGFLAPVIALSLAFLPVTARVMRSAALRERNLPYIEALHLQGVSGLAICVRHLVPNLMPLLLVQATVGFGYAMLDLAAISFLGLGPQPPDPSWGVMVANGKSAILGGHPEQSLYAAIVIVVAVVAVNLVGERLAVHYEIGESS
ncbi:MULTISPECIES: ABC transporter permease [Amycolatopsis]|uniref:ABC transporter permease n=1 Tax=Amycolatopsis thermalba TaxID=944492 RepID=A0ABY4NUC4_9PSEU|nr:MULTISPECIES: ABC transporter permease [Amycolatopsis]OXM72968.1 ABC transporter permease [Amycolatopsis sp. KNN50.9b]UQS23679.1 ABC transporter permease [Amycolatopsis thermalba]